LAGRLAANRIYNLSIAEAACEARKEASSKIVQKYGEIYRHQARRDIALDNDNEKEVVNIRNAQLARQWKKAYKKVMQELVIVYADCSL
jgi:hypothetical protein